MCVCEAIKMPPQGNIEPKIDCLFEENFIDFTVLYTYYLINVYIVMELSYRYPFYPSADRKNFHQRQTNIIEFYK
jgi:hypothetical protein